MCHAFQSGKTVISNVLSESTEHFMGDYRPTQGCRILEFEVADINVSGKTVKAEIELWDCSGDHKYEHFISHLVSLEQFIS